MEFKEIWKRLKGIIIFGICYLTTFFFMEARDVPINIIHTKFDDLIPFCQYFIIPYVIWYVYVCGTVLYLGLTDKTLKEYNRFIANMILGMIIFCNHLSGLSKWSEFETGNCGGWLLYLGGRFTLYH